MRELPIKTATVSFTYPTTVRNRARLPGLERSRGPTRAC
jgi:hypothetical protein